jgi:hypothetical protein
MQDETKLKLAWWGVAAVIVAVGVWWWVAPKLFDWAAQ